MVKTERLKLFVQDLSLYDNYSKENVTISYLRSVWGRICTTTKRGRRRTRGIMYMNTSNGGYRREEKCCKHWSIFTMLLSSVTVIFLIC